jgi:uncharacterized membrane protein YbjE (DUF340 family)
VDFDPFLYVALGAGILAGQLTRVRSPWTGRATRATVVVLVGLLGTLLDAVPVDSLLLELPLALGFAGLILGATAGAYLLMVRPTTVPDSHPATTNRADPVPFGLILLVALVGGFLLGRAVVLPSELALTWALYALLALVGFDLQLARFRARDLGIPLTAAGAGAVGAAAVFALVSGVPWYVSLATPLAFGWYTLAGPLVAARAGALLGLLAFLANFFRENLTMVLSPYVGRRLRGPGLTALGGATAMDTTLYFVTRYGDEGSSGVALTCGLVLTLAAGLVLPLVLALP